LSERCDPQKCPFDAMQPPFPGDIGDFVAYTDVAFPYSQLGRHAGLPVFGALSPGPPVPLSTLQRSPRDGRCKTQGQDGVASPFL